MLGDSQIKAESITILTKIIHNYKNIHAMRKELELIETIENYLKGNLSETDKVAFEKKINENPELKKEVELQKQILKGIERTGLKQSAKQGFKKHKFNKGLKNWGLGGLAVAVIALSSVFVYNNVAKSEHKENAAYDLPELNEQGEKLWSDADKYLEPQNFELNADQDTVVETADGIVIAIPANSFLDANGQPAKGKIQLEVKEALNASDIMKAGLNTKSGDKLLETGGMFYINARQDGASLKIDSKNPLYAEVPTDEVKPGMQLFEGKRLADGSIDWVNPKPIVKDLIPVDILSLNFYPPNYLDSLKSWGYNKKDKKFTDSLYYSFASYFTEEYNKLLEAEAVNHMNWLFNKAANNIYSQQDRLDTTGYKPINNNLFTGPFGINPSKIKAIWNEKFQNTLLATREFEERLPFIFRTCDNEVLDMYINNLDKNLSSIDSMVAQPFNNLPQATEEWDGYKKGYPEFLKFAARGDGKVKNGNTNVRLLKAYYEQKSKMYADAIAKTQNEFWQKQVDANLKAEEKRANYSEKDIVRLEDNFKKELNVNLDEAYRQLGKKRPRPTPEAPYGVHITTTGWLNVDTYVIESTLTRTTLDYTDPQTGKKAVIKYEPLTVSISDYKNYDRVLVYLLPEELNSFMRVANKNEVFEEKLNELMTYKMICIAYKGEESFYFSQDNVKPGSLSVSLVKTTNADIKTNVNKISKRSQSKAMNDELNYFAFEKEEAKRQVELEKINELTNKIRPVIFPCMPAPVYDTTATEKYSYK